MAVISLGSLVGEVVGRVGERLDCEASQRGLQLYFHEVHVDVFDPGESHARHIRRKIFVRIGWSEPRRGETREQPAIRAPEHGRFAAALGCTGHRKYAPGIVLVLGHQEAVRRWLVPFPMRRFAALGYDYLLVLPYIMLLWGMGLGLRALNVLPAGVAVHPLLIQAIAFTVLTLPVVLVLAYLDSEQGRGTFGKRRFGLSVVGRDGAQIRFGRSLVRALIKVALPWELAHAALWQVVAGGSGTLIILLYVACYAVVIVQVLLAVVGSRRTIHDRVTETSVVVRPSVTGAQLSGETEAIQPFDL